MKKPNGSDMKVCTDLLKYCVSQPETMSYSYSDLLLVDSGLATVGRDLHRLPEESAGPNRAESFHEVSVLFVVVWNVPFAADRGKLWR